MVALFLIEGLLVALAFWLLWTKLGGKRLYLEIVHDEAAELRRKIAEIDDRLAGLPDAESSGGVAAAVDFLRGELGRERRRLAGRLARIETIDA